MKSKSKLTLAAATIFLSSVIYYIGDQITKEPSKENFEYVRSYDVNNFSADVYSKDVFGIDPFFVHLESKDSTYSPFAIEAFDFNGDLLFDEISIQRAPNQPFLSAKVKRNLGFDKYTNSHHFYMVSSLKSSELYIAKDNLEFLTTQMSKNF